MFCLQAAILTGRRSKSAVSLAEVDDSVRQDCGWHGGHPHGGTARASLWLHTMRLDMTVCGTLTPGKLPDRFAALLLACNAYTAQMFAEL